MNKTFALILTLGVSTVVFAADDKPTTTPPSNFVQKREIVKDKASEVNKEVVKPTVQEVKKEAVEVKKQAVNTASNLNAQRKKWGF